MATQRDDPYASRLDRAWPPGTQHAVVAGTLASFDLSGFTKLTERLAEHGREGAEEITVTVNGLFERLIDRVAAVDGDVVSFGGDAILVLFQGLDHARRACRAAAAMQRDILAHGRVDTTRGAVRLRMSAGVHSGTFHVVAVGPTSMRHLLFVGPDATRTVELEGEAKAGQVFLSPDTVAALPRPWWRQVAGGVVLRTAAVPSPDVSPATAIALDPAPMAIGEHRLATVAFVKAAHIDDRIEAGDIDAVVAALLAVGEVLADAATRFGITWLSCDIAPDAAKSILVAGVPDAHEDDDERLLRAVRHISDATRPLPIDVAIGVNGGPVFAGDLGHRRRRTFTLMGDDVNLAARLMAKAGSGEVVVNPSVLARSAAIFAAEPLEPFYVKGKRAPQHAVKLGELRERQRAVASRRVVGRTAELARIGSAIESSVHGQGGAVEVVAPAGLGKTALVEEGLRRAEGAVVGRGGGDPYRVATPFSAIGPAIRALLHLGAQDGVDALERWCRTAAPALQPWLPLLATAIGLELPDTPEVARLPADLRASRLHEAVASALGTAGEPQVLLVDDAHWADEASIELLGALARRASIASLCVLVARRPWSRSDDWLGGSSTRVDLGPLDVADARRLLLDVLGEVALADDVIERLLAQADGHPLFVVELVDAVASGATDVPDTVERLVAARIDGLAAADRLLLRQCAVAGRRFTPQLVARFIGDPALARWPRFRALDALVERQGDELAFRHDLLREVAYRGLSAARRRELHGRVADTLLADDPDPPVALCSVIATHFDAAARPDAAAPYAARAADAAVRASAWGDAVAMFDIALRAGTDGPGRWRLLVGRGTAHERLGRYAAAERDLSAAGADVDAARVMQRQGRFLAAMRCARRAGRAAEGDAERAAALLREASILHQTGRYRAAVGCAQRAGALVPPGDDGLRGAVLTQLHHSASALGEPTVAIVDEAMACLRSAGDDVGLGNLLLNVGGEAAYRGAWLDAIDRFHASVEAFDRAGDSVGVLLARNNLAEIMLEQGRFAEARQLLDSVRRGFVAAGDQFMVACCWSALGTIAARSGDDRSAGELLGTARAELERLGADDYVLDADLRLVERDLWANRADLATDRLDELEGRIGASGTAGMTGRWAKRLRSWAAAQAGELSVARVLALQCLAEAEAAGVPAERALSLATLEALDRVEGRSTDPARIAQRLAIVASLGLVWLPELPVRPLRG